MNQSIEDASRKEFQKWLDNTGRGWSEIAFAAWQAARQSSQSEPVAISVPTAPKKIWLCIGDTDFDEVEREGWKWNDLAEVTWSTDRIDQCDIPYIRADLAAPQQAIPSGWISVKDSLPEPWRENSIVSKEVFVSYMDGSIRRYGSGGIHLKNLTTYASNDTRSITHWMPIPSLSAAPIERDK
jgi:hypothetical protein